MGNGTGLTNSMDFNVMALRGVANEVVSESNHIVVFYDRGDVTRLFEIVKENGRIKEKELKRYNTLDNCVDPQFLSDVLKLVDQTYQSDSYGIVFSSHGGGWASTNVFNGYVDELVSSLSYSEPLASPSFCGQDGFEYLDIPDMADAIDQSGLHFDYILFDACFMGSIEAIYELRNCTDYVIASPCEVLADGFPHSKIIPLLFTEGHMLKSVCNVYVDYYMAKTGNDQSAVIALTDCRKLDALAEEVYKVNTDGGADFDISDIQPYEGFVSHLFVDLEHYYELCTNGNLTSDFMSALKAAIPYSAHTDQFFSAYNMDLEMIPITRSCGVSCFVWDPESEASTMANEEYKKTAWAKATGR